jgi:hypothetical protein
MILLIEYVVVKEGDEVMNDGLRKYCPKCNKSKHESEAAYCALCGTKLKNEPKRDFYLRLNIPDSKIDIEMNRSKVFCGFPFFLRKADAKSVQVVLIDDYPKCSHVIKEHAAILNESNKILMTDELLNSFLNDGFLWIHESEMVTWY